MSSATGALKKQSEIGDNEEQQWGRRYRGRHSADKLSTRRFSSFCLFISGPPLLFYYRFAVFCTRGARCSTVIRDSSEDKWIKFYY